MTTFETRPSLMELIDRLDGELIVSCQAPSGHPMRDTQTIARVAKSVLMGGAGGLRINSPADIREIRAFTDVPIIGLYKEAGKRRDVITIHKEQARDLALAGADIVAVDTTSEVCDNIPEMLRSTAAACEVALVADISTLEEGLLAWKSGVAFVGTTLSGYTPYTLRDDEAPDLTLISELATRGVRVIAEGRFSTPAEVSRAFTFGAFAVVVGGAITDPAAITRRFVATTLKHRKD